MVSYVVDVSVLVKIVLDEDDTEAEIVDGLYEQFLKDEIDILVPSFWGYEAGNVIKNNRNLTVPKAETFDILLSSGFHEIEFDIADYQGVLSFSERYDVSFYDAAYGYLAQRENVYLITADKRFQKKVDDGWIILLRDFQ